MQQVSATIFSMFRLFNLLSTIVGGCLENCKRAWSSLEESLSSKVYIFFNNNPSPYFIKSVNEKASGSATPEWIYDSATKTYTQYDSEDEDPGFNTPLPILSMEITYKDKVYYDLTEFIETIRVKADSEDMSPCISHLLGAWSLSSGIVLDATRGFEVKMIDSRANIVEASIYDFMELNERLAAGMGTIAKEDVTESIGEVEATKEE